MIQQQPNDRRVSDIAGNVRRDNRRDDLGQGKRLNNSGIRGDIKEKTSDGHGLVDHRGNRRDCESRDDRNYDGRSGTRNKIDAQADCRGT